MNVPQDLKYTKEHEWVKLEGNLVTIGVTDHAQHKLGDIVFVDLPQIGKKVKQLEILCEVESVKAVSEVYAPLSGEVTEVNANLENAPEKVNESPYDEGWIARLKVEDAGPSRSPLGGEELGNLMTSEEYRDYVKNL